jgi:hypothetical protein
LGDDCSEGDCVDSDSAEADPVVPGDFGECRGEDLKKLFRIDRLLLFELKDVEIESLLVSQSIINGIKERRYFCFVNQK